MLSRDIRRCFLKFFENNGHKIEESSSVIPHNDPTLLFTNAGMVQFKDFFTGRETGDRKRVSTAQKCIRAGGKHNDLDQVGFTSRHHTFFEMLGNFSFGDYFKEEAVYFAWTFLVKELQLPRERLSATVYRTDEEAKILWKKIAGDIPVIPISGSDNFWSMGETGPCGPCSEIFYDRGEKFFGGMPGTPDQDGDRYTEIWNIVFMQFEQMKNGSRISLGKKSVDTGMGLERITSVMQGKEDNYLTDLFKEIIDEIKSFSGTNFADTHPSYKVIADHIRSVSFLIAEGVLPSNEGRGYVLRRIIRRAMRHGNFLNVREPFLFRLSNVLVDVMKDVYPELERGRSVISSALYSEEEKFLTTLDRGLKILQNEVNGMAAGSVLSGEKAFKLYDTYGFPLDLTRDILKSENIDVDTVGFEAALREQKNRAKWVGSGEAREDAIWCDLAQKIGPVEFSGYEKEKDSSKILAIIRDGKEIDVLSSGKAFIVTESTPFYSECGGQCGDTGFIKGEEGVFKVTNTGRFQDTLIVHEGELLSGRLKKLDRVESEIDAEKRGKIRANHTAIHLLHAALRRVSGNHAVQRGSFLNENRLRFDFSGDSRISDDKIREIEGIVNGWILSNLPVKCEIMSKDEALAAGATALFGEKYGDSVRTVSVMSGDERISSELCGGTHVSATGRIGLFKILSENGIGSGVRRIEAVTGEKILDHLRNIERILRSAAENLRCDPSELEEKTKELTADLKRKDHEILLKKQETALEKVRKTTQAGVTVCSLEVADCNMNELSSLNDLISAENPSGVIVVANRNEDKVSLIISVSPDLQNRIGAVGLLKAGLVPLNGKGGGNAAFARGGGSGKAEAAIEAVKNAVNPT
ncbi:MAG: alanine--tRNA ligase [Holosporaceae bacterium]|jgi:alanyl-tRNA synthetase|nr:alanine--tRNA ligase [Holosporaceae bacterium]